MNTLCQKNEKGGLVLQAIKLILGIFDLDRF